MGGRPKGKTKKISLVNFKVL